MPPDNYLELNTMINLATARTQTVPFLLSSFQIDDQIMIQIKGEEIIFIHMIAVFIMFVCLFTCFSQEGVFAFGSTFGFEAPPKHCCLKTKGTTKSKKNG